MDLLKEKNSMVLRKNNELFLDKVHLGKNKRSLLLVSIISSLSDRFVHSHLYLAVNIEIGLFLWE